MASSNMSPLRNFLNSIKNSVYNISIDGIGNTDINAGSLFNGFPNLYRAITLNNMNYVTNMGGIFNNTRKLSQIPNHNFNTSNVTNMSNMFHGCSKLSQASVNNIVASCANATKVTNKSFTDIGITSSTLQSYIQSAPKYSAAVANGWVL